MSDQDIKVGGAKPCGCEYNQTCPECKPSSLAPASGSDELEAAKGELYRIAAKLVDLRDKLSAPRYGACAHEIGQTMRALCIAVDTIKRVQPESREKSESR